jgi:Uma2 family endonuclease
MSGGPPKRPATYEDLLRVPADQLAEIIDGELFTSRRPSIRHVAAASAVGEELGPPFWRGRGGPGGWIILDQPELHIVDQVLVPDLAGWRRDRMPEIPDAAFLDLAPDWVCEVLSPSTVALDRTRKRHHYARAGVTHLWFVDPDPQTLEVYRLDDGSWRLLTSVAGDVLARAAPFEAVGFELAAVWAR